MAFSSASLIVPAINHLIATETWSASRLRPFSGQLARIQAPPFQFDLIVRSDGLFEATETHGKTADVTVSLPGDAIGKMIVGDMALVFSSAQISGSAEFAEALAFVFRNLRWDAEADLAGVFGDIAGYRGTQAVQSFLSWQKSAALNITQNIKEYLSEESRSVVTQREIDNFSDQTRASRDDLARLEKRIAKL